MAIEISFSIHFDVDLVEVSLQIHYFFWSEVVLVSELNHYLVVVELSCNFLAELSGTESSKESEHGMHSHIFHVRHRTFAHSVVACNADNVHTEEGLRRVFVDVAELLFSLRK